MAALAPRSGLLFPLFAWADLANECAECATAPGVLVFSADLWPELIRLISLKSPVCGAWAPHPR
jgi:hypothetical protein